MTKGDMVSKARDFLECRRESEHFTLDGEVFLDKIWLYGYIAI